MQVRPLALDRAATAVRGARPPCRLNAGGSSRGRALSAALGVFPSRWRPLQALATQRGRQKKRDSHEGTGTRCFIKRPVLSRDVRPLVRRPPLRVGTVACRTNQKNMWGSWGRRGGDPVLESIGCPGEAEWFLGPGYFLRGWASALGGSGQRSEGQGIALLFAVGTPYIATPSLTSTELLSASSVDKAAAVGRSGQRAGGGRASERFNLLNMGGLDVGWMWRGCVQACDFGGSSILLFCWTRIRIIAVGLYKRIQLPFCSTASTRSSATTTRMFERAFGFCSGYAVPILLCALLFYFPVVI